MVARKGMVVSSHHAAARAGASILERGGNAIDAAVATAFAVGVAQPFSAGVGGGAFALVRLADGDVVALDAREVAPAKATPNMFVEPGVAENASVLGPLAVAVPSFVPGMVELLEAHGTMTLAEVLAPAISLAEEGVEVGDYHAGMVGFMRSRFSRTEFAETWRIQFAPFDPATMKGRRLIQRDLGRSLRLLAKDGEGVFRNGEIGRAIVREVVRRGGLITLDDLRRYEPKWRKPVVSDYRGFRVVSFPPPSSGGVVLVQALNVLEGFPLERHAAGDVQAVHLLAEAMKLAFADRAAYMGDSDFVDVPIEALVSKSYASRQRSRIDELEATTITAPGAVPEDSGTTHFSVTDSEGRAVALTMTINTPFGSGITVPGTGVILNNEMDDFAIATGTPNSYGLVDTRGANLVAGRKRPLSSMTPTILDRDGRLFMVTGSPGGPRIISTTLLTIVNVIDWKMDPRKAVAAPRVHHQWDPNRLEVEPSVSEEVVRGLRARGHEVMRSPRTWSAAEVIVVDPVSGLHLGGADPRTDGAAVGVDPVTTLGSAGEPVSRPAMVPRP
ncbi:MAG: gamma-glutamyltransferase [Deltaproteobacteria bacterium]|nr:gamma-glutamyltransferase [Deltaproteobacteria bacterium]